MINNKQSSVEWLIEHYTFADLTAESWEMIQQQAKAMHKEEIMNANEDLSTANGEQYYNETYANESNN